MQINRKYIIKLNKSEKNEIQLKISDFEEKIKKNGIEAEENYKIEFNLSETEGRNIDDVLRELEQEIDLIRHYNVKRLVNTKNLVTKNFDSIYQRNCEVSKDEYRVCRYCGEDDEKYFKTKAHSIPEALGNKSLFNLYECDNCNNKFGSGIEQDLVKYLTPILFSGAILGKKSQKEIRESNDMIKSYFYKKVENGIEMVFKDNLENSSTEINEEKKYVLLEMKRYPYVPYNVFLGFCKIAYNLLPQNKVQDYIYLKDLINGREVFENTIIIKENFYEKKNSVYEPKDFISYATLVESEEKSEKYLILILKLRYYIYEIMIPKTKNKELLVLRGKTILKELKRGTTYINLSKKEEIKDDFKEFCIGFEEIKKESVKKLLGNI